MTAGFKADHAAPPAPLAMVMRAVRHTTVHKCTPAPAALAGTALKLGHFAVNRARRSFWEI
ncbi:hypothetical protein [Pseudooceanicola marinus]|uniref:hypothetical protein n=1 Tax=Pseudooceanicola marinus TaxID=396013 RepID=UPI001CD532A8|nr:hypothetical protein [Pseudooceanicola marinus]MCA1334437.1 hypothetical protein [Pseudooceanicola marinus]